LEKDYPKTLTKLALISLDSQIKGKLKSHKPFSVGLVKLVLLQVCLALVECKQHKNTPINPLNILILDNFELQIAHLRDKTAVKIGPKLAYYC